MNRDVALHIAEQFQEKPQELRMSALTRFFFFAQILVETKISLNKKVAYMYVGK